MRFLDVKTDFAFKKVFGSERSKPLLMNFLNALLEYEGEYAITDLTRAIVKSGVWNIKQLPVFDHQFV